MMFVYKLLFLSVFIVQDSAHRTRRQSCVCKPISQCAGRYRMLSEFKRRSCELSQGKVGVCCSDISKGGSPSVSLGFRQSEVRLRFPANLNDREIDKKLKEKTTLPSTQKSTADQSTRAHRLFLGSRKSDKDIYEAAYKLLKLQDIGISIRASNDITGVDASNSDDVAKICPWTGGRRPKCSSTNGPEYRQIDGSCNNKQQPLFGMSNTPFQRIVFADYSAGQSARKSRSGGELPNPRLVTTTVFQNGDPPNHSQISEKFIQFGQFLDHDLTHTPVFTVDCCHTNREGKPWVFPSSPKHDECMPIRIMRNDTFWGPKGRDCMEFSRNMFAPTLNCRAGSREQVNSLTHWIDLSNIYGSTKEEYRNARDPFDRRLLRVSRSRTGDQLPASCPKARSGTEPEIEACREVCTEPSRKCFYSGDFRINEQPGLTIEHLVWIREHNRVAEELTDINPSWNQETVFQETRRIITAEYQHIIYNEWLPLALGIEFMKAYNLFPLSVGSGYTLDYDESMDPRITNEFAAAAFRFGHSMVKSTLAETNTRGRSVVRDLKESFNQPNLLQQPGFIEDAIRSSSLNSAAERDQVFSDDLVNHLFQEDQEGGLDLMSINIQRGRDRGIPGYNRLRKECASGRFKQVRTFADLTKDGYMSKEEVRRLSFLYEDVEDIDLFVGGMLEETHRDSVLGPTFKCIVGDQMVRLKKGDRFWYENSGPHSFSLVQLNEVRKSSMSRIICDNFNIDKIQALAFRTPDGINQMISCKDDISIPKLDLQLFKQ